MHALDANDAALGQKPSVQMDQLEAERLSLALTAARARVRAAIATAGRIGGPSGNDLRALTDELRVLEAFHRAHCEAHGLGWRE